MAGQSSAARERATRSLLSIGQVLAKLSREFPDLTPSKLRFLEEQKLVEPARTSSGYRKFSAEDIDRLRLILTLQRDQYLPLKVIREYLEQLDAGDQPSLPGGGAVIGVVGMERRMTRDELVAAASASASLLDEAIAASLIVARESYDDDALAVLRALVTLSDHGIEPRHLRGLRAAVARDLGLIDSALRAGSRQNKAADAARRREDARSLADGLNAVRESLVRSGLNQIVR